MGEKRLFDEDSGSDKKPKSSKKEKKEKKSSKDLDPDEAAAKAERKAAKKAKKDAGGGGGGDEDGEDAIETVVVECKGQTGRIIGKGGSKIREIEDLTGCILKIDQAKGTCTIKGPTVAPAVQEVKNIVQEGRERDEVAHAPGGPPLRARSQSQGRDDRGAYDRGAYDEPVGTSTPNGESNLDGESNLNGELPFGKPPSTSASRNDTGQNDWQCTCGSSNFARRSTCFRCKAPRSGGVDNTNGYPAGGARTPVRIPSAHVQSGTRSEAPTQGSDANGYEVFVKYLPHTSEEAEVSDFFSQFGEILGDVRLIRNPTTGQCKGAGFVTFAHEHARQAALAKDGIKFGGRHLSITVAKTGTFGVRATEQAFGTHTPAMLRETIAALVAPDPNGTYVDGTFGRGGHTRGILAALGSNGKLHAFDMDPEAIKEAKKLEAEDSRFTIHHAPFGCMDTVLKPLGVKCSGVFLDLGISSPQFDDGSRGFRPEQDGPLDLRFDITQGVPASDFLKKVNRDELVRILHEYGETTDPVAARRIADAVCLAVAEDRLPSTTKAFASLVASAKGKEYQAMHPAKLTFQALRIHLNQEFDEMRRGMRAAAEVMMDGGRLGVLTWKHSECAILVDFHRHFEVVRPTQPLLEWMRTNHPEKESALPTVWGLTVDDAQRPSEREMRENSRSRSAILHVLRKVNAGHRLADVERAAYPLLGWAAPPATPEPPPVTFKYEAANAGGDGETPNKKQKKEKKEKKEKSAKKDKA